MGISEGQRVRVVQILHHRRVLAFYPGPGYDQFLNILAIRSLYIRNIFVIITACFSPTPCVLNNMAEGILRVIPIVIKTLLKEADTITKAVWYRIRIVLTCLRGSIDTLDIISRDTSNCLIY